MKKVALVGLGYWGPKLLRNLIESPRVNGVVVVDRNVDRLAAACRQFPSARPALNLEEALEDDDVRAVFVATPVETHGELTRLALEAGRHVLVEKPLTASTQEAIELTRLAESFNLRLMVGHTFLFSPRLDCIVEYLKRGALGRVHYMTSARLNLGLHRSDANVIWDLAPHDFSILFHLLGETPDTVQTVAGSANRFTLPDVAFINLTFPSGALASVTVSWLAPRKVRNTVIVGEQQMIVYDDTNSDEPVKIYDQGVIIEDSNSFGENQLTYRYGDTIAPHVVAAEPLGLEIDHFLQRIDDDEPLKSDGWFGASIVAALEAAHRSWELGGVKVDVPSEELHGDRHR
ncbi:MAG TPA: Gfo/Idh/MocA family oxidoreductase [Acidimicrobiales bacterium]|jgi:predicted dehydrogenase